MERDVEFFLDVEGWDITLDSLADSNGAVLGKGAEEGDNEGRKRVQKCICISAFSVRRPYWISEGAVVGPCMAPGRS